MRRLLEMGCEPGVNGERNGERNAGRIGGLGCSIESNDAARRVCVLSTIKHIVYGRQTNSPALINDR